MNKLFPRNIKSLLQLPLIRRHLSGNAQQSLTEIQSKAGAESWTYAALLVVIPFSSLYAYKKLVLDKIPDITEVSRLCYTWGPEAEYFRKFNPRPRDDDFGPPPKEPALTRLIRKSTQYHCDEGYKKEVQMLDECYEQMMAHIEKKKFPDLPRFPSYVKIFSTPPVDIRHENAKLPRGFDD